MNRRVSTVFVAAIFACALYTRQVSIVQATTTLAVPLPHEAVYHIRLSHVSLSDGPRAVAGTMEIYLARTCDG
jgi:uncharacterized lipoprotein YbaY